MAGRQQCPPRRARLDVDPDPVRAVSRRSKGGQVLHQASLDVRVELPVDESRGVRGETQHLRGFAPPWVVPEPAVRGEHRQARGLGSHPQARSSARASGATADPARCSSAPAQASASTKSAATSTKRSRSPQGSSPSPAIRSAVTTSIADASRSSDWRRGRFQRPSGTHGHSPAQRATPSWHRPAGLVVEQRGLQLVQPRPVEDDARRRHRKAVLGGQQPRKEQVAELHVVLQ